MASRSDGYTLVEVVATVVLLGILAAIVIPRFSTQYFRIGLQSDLDTMDGVISQLEKQVLTQNQTLEMGLVKNSNGDISGYQIGQNLNLDGSTANATILRSETFSSGTKGSASNGVRKVLFSPSAINSLTSTGEAATPSIIAIELESGDGVTGQIQIDRTTRSRWVISPYHRVP